MNPLIAILPLLNSALAVVAAFKGSAAQAKASALVQDALAIIGALSPLVQQFGSGAEVTPDQVKAALAGKDAALAAFDQEIARQEAANPDD
jgi:hypothetical protein